MPAEDAGAPYVALIGDGIDYRAEAIAKRLARDGEGDPMGWDFAGDDLFAFNETSGQTLLATHIIDRAKTGGLVVIRMAPSSPTGFPEAVKLATQTPAKIILTPPLTAGSSTLAWIAEAAARFPDTLFIAPAGADSANLDKRAKLDNVDKIDNLIIVSTADPGANVGARAITLAIAFAIAPTQGQPTDRTGLAAALIAADAMTARAAKPDLPLADLVKRITADARPGTPRRARLGQRTLTLNTSPTGSRDAQ
ncbi:MAG: hypothetical protein AAFQ45_11870 [Pseudomonadota bacterium]